MVQWLRLHASISRCMGLIAGQGTKNPHATWRPKKEKKKVYEEKKFRTEPLS